MHPTVRALTYYMDLNSGYWQVNMDPEIRVKTAVICAMGLYKSMTDQLAFWNQNSVASATRS